MRYHFKPTKMTIVKKMGTSLAVQWLRLTGSMGSIPDRGTKIPHAAQCGPKIKDGE